MRLRTVVPGNFRIRRGSVPELRNTRSGMHQRKKPARRRPFVLAGGARFELATNGSKVDVSTWFSLNVSALTRVNTSTPADFPTFFCAWAESLKAEVLLVGARAGLERKLPHSVDSDNWTFLAGDLGPILRQFKARICGLHRSASADLAVRIRAGSGSVANCGVACDCSPAAMHRSCAVRHPCGNDLDLLGQKLGDTGFAAKRRAAARSLLG